jgi:cold shock protein
MPTGTVKFFDNNRGYGFIIPEGRVDMTSPDVFVHISAVQRSGLNELKQGQIIEYDLVPNRGSRSSADNLRLVSEAPARYATPWR